MRRSETPRLPPLAPLVVVLLRASSSARLPLPVFDGLPEITFAVCAGLWCSEGGRRGRRREDPDGKGVVNLWCAGEEPPESLFTKELKRRGLPPTSLLEEGVAGRGAYSGLREEVEFEQEERSGGGRGRGPRKQNGVASADYHMGLENQRERSMALNSEGLEGFANLARPKSKRSFTGGLVKFILLVLLECY